MKNFLNKQVVDVVKSNINSEENMVDVIMSVLSLGKEAAYRRIRGEVLFTFNEAVQLSSRFGFSLDTIAGLSLTDMTVVKMRILNSDQTYDDYKQTLRAHLKLYKEINDSNISKVSLAYNVIPFLLYSRFESLSKFKLYRWKYQMDMNPSNTPFSEMEHREDLWALHNELVSQIDRFKEVCYVLDRHVFSTFVNDIHHFVQLGLINDEDCRLLKKELSELLALFEKMMREGSHNAKSKVSIYISNIDFDSSYSYFEADNFTYCNLRVYSEGSIFTQDSKICQIHKRWIESLKRYSVLVSGCGEMERVKFISTQKELINFL